MNRFRMLIVGAALVITLILGGVAYAVFRTPDAASGPLTAIPLDATAASAAPSAAASASASSSASAAPSSASSASAVPSSAASASASAAASSAATDSQPIVAQIVAAESEARFTIDEVLNGAPKTVVGTTKQVAGELAVDPRDPTKSRVGTIQINARDLTTDSDFRNRALKNQILQTNQYELITFTPTALTGLPSSSTIGQSYSFQIVGNLTIRDVTKEVTFDVTATPVSESRLEGSARATINYADFGINIPQVRQVTNVSDQVGLEIDFVAEPS